MLKQAVENSNNPNLQLSQQSLEMALRGSIMVARAHEHVDQEIIIRNQIMSLLGANLMRVIVEN